MNTVTDVNIIAQFVAAVIREVLAQPEQTGSIQIIDSQPAPALPAPEDRPRPYYEPLYTSTNRQIGRLSSAEVERSLRTLQPRAVAPVVTSTPEVPLYDTDRFVLAIAENGHRYLLNRNAYERGRYDYEYNRVDGYCTPASRGVAFTGRQPGRVLQVCYSDNMSSMIDWDATVSYLQRVGL